MHGCPMKWLIAFFKRLPRKNFAVVFACFFMLQGMNFLQVYKTPDHGGYSSSITNVNAHSAEQAGLIASICAKLNHEKSPLSGHCDHVGFCALCSINHGAEVLASVMPLPQIIAPLNVRDVSLVRLSYFDDKDIPSPRTGLNYTWSSIAPPQA